MHTVRNTCSSEGTWNNSSLLLSLSWSWNGSLWYEFIVIYYEGLDSTFKLLFCFKYYELGDKNICIYFFTCIIYIYTPMTLNEDFFLLFLNKNKNGTYCFESYHIDFVPSNEIPTYLCSWSFPRIIAVVWEHTHHSICVCARACAHVCVCVCVCVWKHLSCNTCAAWAFDQDFPQPGDELDSSVLTRAHSN